MEVEAALGTPLEAVERADGGVVPGETDCRYRGGTVELVLLLYPGALLPGGADQFFATLKQAHMRVGDPVTPLIGVGDEAFATRYKPDQPEVDMRKGTYVLQLRAEPVTGASPSVEALRTLARQAASRL
jgi:hypothetical protein